MPRYNARFNSDLVSLISVHPPVSLLWAGWYMGISKRLGKIRCGNFDVTVPLCSRIMVSYPSFAHGPMSMEAKHPNFIYTVSQFVCGSGCVAGLFPLPYFAVSEWEYDT